MFPILVASDIHGDYKALEKLFQISSEKNCSQFLFAGDLGLGYSPDIVELLKKRNIPFLPVLGNCDSPWDFSSATLSQPPFFQIREYEGRKVFITHGHRLRTPEDAGFPVEKGSIIITGHTHIAKLYKSNGYYYLNPGSASRPRGQETASFALIKKNEIQLCYMKNQKVFKQLTII